MRKSVTNTVGKAKLAEMCRTSFLQSFHLGELLAFGDVYLRPLVRSHTSLHSLDIRLERMATEGSVMLEDLTKIRTVTAKLVRQHEEVLRDLLLLFATTIEVFAERPPLNSHCHFSIGETTCGTCIQKSKFFTWQVINVTKRSELAASARAGTMPQTHICTECESPLNIGSPFFYCDPSRGEFLLFDPWSSETAFDEMRQGCMSYLQDLPPEFRGNTETIAFFAGFDRPFEGPTAQQASLFRIQSHEVLLSVVNEQIFYQSLPLRPDFDFMNGLPAVQIKDAFDSGQIAQAIRLAARFFHRDQIQADYLISLAASLATLGRESEATFIRTEAGRLTGKLHDVRLIRNSRSTQSSPHDSRFMKIWENGLPESWEFVELIALVKKLGASRE